MATRRRSPRAPGRPTEALASVHIQSVDLNSIDPGPPPSLHRRDHWRPGSEAGAESCGQEPGSGPQSRGCLGGHHLCPTPVTAWLGRAGKRPPQCVRQAQQRCGGQGGHAAPQQRQQVCQVSRLPRGFRPLVETPGNPTAGFMLLTVPVVRTGRLSAAVPIPLPSLA